MVIIGRGDILSEMAKWRNGNSGVRKVRRSVQGEWQHHHALYSQVSAALWVSIPDALYVLRTLRPTPTSLTDLSAGQAGQAIKGNSDC